MKTKNKKTTALLLALATIFFVSGKAASAQTPIEGVVTVVATVNIYEPSIIAQNKNNVQLFFNVANREEVQPQLKYSVRLTKIANNKESLVDEKIYADIFDIGKGETISKAITYTAPDFLKGKYQVYIDIRNNKSLRLANAFVGEITLEGSGQFLEIIPGSCSLSVQGESGNKKYFLAQGVDVSNEENLIGACDVLNNFGSAISATPQFQTYYRTVFGEPLSTEDQSSINFRAGERKTITFILPKASKPQSYDAKLTFLDSENKVISNSIPFHYVVGGVGATIQNLRLDKDYYSAGETANILFNWSGPADTNIEARNKASVLGEATISLSMNDGEGKACAQPIETKSKVTGEMTMKAAVSADCKNPVVAAEIRDSQGNLLDKNVFSIQSKNAPKGSRVAQQPTAGPGDQWGKFYSIMAILIVILGAVVYYFRQKNRQKARDFMKTIISFLLLGGACLFFTPAAKADTFTVSATWAPDWNANFTVGLNKPTYAPNETITASGSAYLTACGNWFVGASLKSTINGTTKNFFQNYEGYGGDFIPTSTQTFTAPAANGNYNAVFTGTFKIRVWCSSSSDCDIDYNAMQDLLDQGKAVPIIGSVDGNEYWLIFQGSYNIPFTVGSSTKPTISMSADPQLIDNGQTSDITWKVANATSCVGTSPTGGTTQYLSDLTPVSESNGYGCVEKDTSNGEDSCGDGYTISINGTTYTKGLGVHAPYDATYALNGNYTSFNAKVGMDDECWGTARFYVYADGTQIYDSGNMTGPASAKSINNLNVTGKNQLRIYLDPVGDAGCDHADWADARLTRAAAATGDPLWPANFSAYNPLNGVSYLTTVKPGYNGLGSYRYTMTCTGPGGTTTAYADIDVRSPIIEDCTEHTYSYSCIYTGGNCTGYCGTTVNSKAKCVATDSCTKETEFVSNPTSFCGASCIDRAVACPACPDSGGDRIEIPPN